MQYPWHIFLFDNKIVRKNGIIVEKFLFQSNISQNWH